MCPDELSTGTAYPAALTKAFDAAKAVVETPFFFTSDISDMARPISLVSSQELIARSEHP